MQDSPAKLKEFLDKKVSEFNRPSFIVDDPISVPHAYSKKQDIEIAGLFAALFAWGNRTTIINKSKELLSLMGNSPYEFCLHHNDADLRRLLQFKHRTFNPTDLLCFIAFLKNHYTHHRSLETAFGKWMGKGDETVEQALNGFARYFFSQEDCAPRTRKHIASPDRKSACKRLNMYLRWMVRNDRAGVDFGIWKSIEPLQLVCPVDLHVARVARRFGLLQRKPIDWRAAIELTENVRAMDPKDPVKYDFALFGLGTIEKYR